MVDNGSSNLDDERADYLRSVADDLEYSSGPEEPLNTVIHGKNQTSFAFSVLVPPGPFLFDSNGE